ncbi:hypothetical protein BofuT4_P095700.1 [Botrytis cinerea T4]|uniref:Heterokaryon incompatibility domain-containing protein n=1 Tax=Botryotinia fuckeliana (strain T4) TaxID=999810 RepID=G2YDL4_BOTF4|nr:hypothetical protein BofuT4_P095700.1 [Botrytis cinerea T4]
MTESLSQIPTMYFTYEPLNPDSDSESLRLITIESSLNENDALTCKLVSTKFAERPRFRAFSYMWGDDTANKTTMLNRAEFHSRNPVAVLGDAVCINQNNIPERNKQLMIMKQIYFRAATVAVWLGTKYER